MTRSFVVCVDGSQPSHRALDTALSLSNDTDRFILACVYEKIHRNKHSLDEDFAQKKQELQNSKMVMVSEFKTRVNQTKRRCEVIVEAVDSIKEGLLNLIETNNADYVVVGNRGLGKLKRTFMGSVSEHLLRKCSCPIIIVK
eukprot:Nk52_evm24s2474 gene=Nk52_evmTU24s2474